MIRSLTHLIVLAILCVASASASEYDETLNLIFSDPLTPGGSEFEIRFRVMPPWTPESELTVVCPAGSGPRLTLVTLDESLSARFERLSGESKRVEPFAFAKEIKRRRSERSITRADAQRILLKFWRAFRAYAETAPAGVVKDEGDNTASILLHPTMYEITHSDGVKQLNLPLGLMGRNHRQPWAPSIVRWGLELASTVGRPADVSSDRDRR